MFVNFSNHPIAGWSEAQQAAAKEYGVSIDIPFPSVAPELESEAIGELAVCYSGKILEQIGSNQATAVVHVMGEMTLAHAVIHLLRRAGITCVSATSERMVRETNQGVKEITFRFVRFRPYVEEQNL